MARRELLVVDKPPKILVHPSVDRSRPDLQSLIQTEFPEARLLHRLDFGTSGILVFGFSKTAQNYLLKLINFIFAWLRDSY